MSQSSRCNSNAVEGQTIEQQILYPLCTRVTGGGPPYSAWVHPGEIILKCSAALVNTKSVVLLWDPKPEHHSTHCPWNVPFIRHTDLKILFWVTSSCLHKETRCQVYPSCISHCPVQGQVASSCQCSRSINYCIRVNFLLLCILWFTPHFRVSHEMCPRWFWLWWCACGILEPHISTFYPADWNTIQKTCNWQNASQHVSPYEVPVNGAKRATVADSSKPYLDFSEQAISNSGSRSKLAPQEPSAEF